MNALTLAAGFFALSLRCAREVRAEERVPRDLWFAAMQAADASAAVKLYSLPATMPADEGSAPRAATDRSKFGGRGITFGREIQVRDDSAPERIRASDVVPGPR